MAYLDENGLEYFWGKIKDRVSSAVAPKANDADVLHKTGTETVSGEKVFSGIQTTAAGNASALLVVKDPNLVKGETPETNHYLSLGFIDSTGNSYAQDVSSRLAVVEYKSPSEADPEGYMQMVDNGFDGGSAAFLRVGHDKDNIRYATAPATSDDRTNSTDIVTRGYMEASEWNWQKSKKNAIVQFKPVPKSDLEPVVDFMFTETPPAEGEKGPDNPSVIAGVSTISVKRQSKNLLTYYRKEGTGNSIVSVQPDGSLLINGTVSEGNYVTIIYAVTWNNTAITPNTSKYIVSVNNAVAFDTVRISCRAPAAYGGWASVNGNDVRMTSVNFTKVLTPMHENAVWDSVLIQLYPNTYSNLVLKPQLELGTVATEFEPSDQNEYTIQLGDTYYGGSLDVATGVMTVRYRMIELSSSDLYSSTPVETTSGIWQKSCLNLNWSQFGLCEAFGYQESAGYNGSNYFCNIYDWDRTGTTVSYHFSRSTFLISVSASSAEEANTYITNLVAEKYAAGTPIVCGYPLETPYTVQLTPTQIRSLPALDKYEPRINTVYTDQEAVQVGYQKYVDYTGCVHTSGYNTITHHNFVHRDVDTGSITITGGSVYGKGGSLQVNGSGASSNPGSFILFSNDDNGNVKALIGKPNGTLTWNNKDITGDVHTTGNETIGGSKTFSSPIVSGSLQGMCRSNTQSILVLYGGTSSDYSGATIALYGATRSVYPGRFQLTACTSSTDGKDLYGTPDGSLVWNGQTIQTTSDERLKTPISEVPDDVLDAWEDVNWGQFQYLDAVAEKGESARLHLGLIAQHVMSVFGKHGLDACAYGILCHEERPAVDEEETVVDAEAYVDGEGVEHPAITHVETRHEDAVDLWMVRYAEAQAMEACCVRRENARLKKRVADLEERLAALELKIS